MAYELGVDLGTTWTAAAVVRAGRPEILTLGNRTAAVPSVLFLTEEDSVLTGDAANRRAITEPLRVAREFKRRVGDPTPLLVGGAPRSAESLMANLLRWVVATATEREGGPPQRVAVSHPANWGPYKLDLLREALRLAEQPTAVTLTEPEAAAIYYATTERVPVGSIIAVYDLGGGTFDVAILRKTENTFEILGEPEGIERLGGIDFDEAVFGHVARELEDTFDELDPDDPATIAAVARLRQECTAAKEALSEDTQVSIPVVVPGVQTEVTLTRAELDAMVRPALAETIPAMRRAMQSAGVEASDIDTILLVGGSSRMPLVRQLVAGELDRPVAVDIHPKHSVALGAALAASVSAPVDRSAKGGQATARRVISTGPQSEDTPKSRTLPAIAVALALVILAGVAFALTRPKDDGATATSTTIAAVAPTTITISGADDPRVTLLEPVTIDATGDKYLIPFRIKGFDYDSNRVHVHFFWDTQAPEDAGTGGRDPCWGEMFTWDGEAPADVFFVTDRPKGAQQVCAIVAIAGHRVLPNTGNCVPLPAG